jgi:hypothetical protein
MCWGWLQPRKRRKHAARRESPCPLVMIAAYLQRRARDEREPSFILCALWKKRLELQAHSRFAIQDGLRASRSRRGRCHEPTPVTPHYASFASYKSAGVHRGVRERGGVAGGGASAGHHYRLLACTGSAKAIAADSHRPSGWRQDVTPCWQREIRDQSRIAHVTGGRSSP